MTAVPERPVIALIDGEHHPPAVRDALDELESEREIAGVIFCGGEEKLPPLPLSELYGHPVSVDVEDALRLLAPAAGTVVDLADEPVLPASAKLELAALALHLGLAYEGPGLRLAPPRYAPIPFDGPTLAVIGTGKRTGKTAVAGHWAGLLRQHDPIVVCMGRGGPADPAMASPALSLDDLLELAAAGRHAASDYLEGAVLAGVRTIGCRRVGGGLAGQPASSNVAAGAVLAATLDAGALIFEGSGACIPPVRVDRTVCVVGPGEPQPLGRYRLLRADLVVAHEGVPAPPGAVRFSLRPEPLETPAPDARVALFTTGATACPGIEPVVVSTNLARRGALAADLDRAVEQGCTTWLTELKAAAIDTVALRARAEGVRVILVRNRPLGLDEALERLFLDAR
jgi:cyclic 2,3-diphosphoglycerate synthase